MGDAEHGAGHQALLSRGAVCSPDQAPVWLFVAALQNLHRLTAPHCQLVAVAGHEVVYDHSQLTATGELRERGAYSILLTAENVQLGVCVLCVHACWLTLSLSSVFCEVRDAREMVSGWLLPSP